MCGADLSLAARFPSQNVGGDRPRGEMLSFPLLPFVFLV